MNPCFNSVIFSKYRFVSLILFSLNITKSSFPTFKSLIKLLVKSLVMFLEMPG